LSEPAKFPAWLCGIARNCSKNWLRQQKRNPLAQSATLSDVADTPANETEPADTVTSNIGDAQLVWQSLADIPETYREPMLMFYRHGAKTSEIADALELTEETVRQRLSRGRKLLKSEIERTVEKTLSATRPDVAFTVAVLAAIPLSATVGCSTSTQSVGFLGGVTAMSGFGIVLFFFVSAFLSTLPTALFAALCFCAFWYAVKNSPTLRTRRFVINAALDLCILFLLRLPIVFVALLIAGIIIGAFFSEDSQKHNNYVLIHFQLIICFIFAAFILYVVLRWRQLLYEDKIEPSKEPGTERSIVLRLINRLINRYRNFCLTARGICVKRNIVLGFVALVCVGHIVMQSWVYMKFYLGFPLSTGQLIAIFASLTVGFLVMIAIYALFFWIVSKAISISWDDAALEKTPPKIPLSQWNEAELRPEGRRQLLDNSVALLCMVPLMLILLNFGSVLALELLSADSIYAALRFLDISALIALLVILSVLTALWCSYNPSRRLLGFARLFLVSGLLAFCFIEHTSLLHLAREYFLRDYFDWLFSGDLASLLHFHDHLTWLCPWRLTAVSFLVYSLLAAAVCYFGKCVGKTTTNL